MSQEVGKVASSNYSELFRILKRDYQCVEAVKNDTPTYNHNILWIVKDRYHGGVKLLRLTNESEYRDARNNVESEQTLLIQAFKEGRSGSEDDNGVKDELSKLYD